MIRVAQAAGELLLIGLSTDDKGPPTAGWCFLATDTGQSWRANGTSWYTKPIGFETAVTFTDESAKLVTITNPLVHSTSTIVGVAVRHSLSPVWIVANVVSVAEGSVDVLLVPMVNPAGPLVQLLSITGTVYVAVTLSTLP